MSTIKNKKTVVIDTDDPRLLDNKIFNPNIAKMVSHTILPTCFLYEQAKKQDINFITPDIYLKSPSKFTNVLLITHLQTPFTKNLIKNGARPLILTCLESPFIAARFYTFLIRYTKQFKHSFVFLGMKKFVSKKSIYHQMYFPQPYNINDFSPKKFEEKNMLTLVSSAKSIKSWWKIILIKTLYGWSIRCIYPERQKLIKFFAQKKGFDLYGGGWNKNNILDDFIIKKIYKGVVNDKFETIKNYKFTVCFENAIFPGYITEKIFDALFAGSVPIYLGAPDIKKYIPSNVFIDMRDFKNYDDLYNYISTMDEQKYNIYMSSIKNFIESEKYKEFSQENYAKSVLEILNKEFASNEKN